MRGSKTGEKPTNQGRESTITATDAYDQIQESNPGHSSGAHHYVYAIPALKSSRCSRRLFISVSNNLDTWVFGRGLRLVPCSVPLHPGVLIDTQRLCLTGTKSYMTKCSDWGRGKGGGREGEGEGVILLWTGFSLGKGEVSIIVIAPCYAKRVEFPAIVCWTYLTLYKFNVYWLVLSFSNDLLWETQKVPPKT